MNNEILIGDCLEKMRDMPDDLVDVAFADPPFNLKKKYNSYYDNKELELYLKWCEEWIYQMVRITKPSGSIFIHNIPKWLTYYTQILNRKAIFKHWITWNAPTAPMGKSLQPSHYGILYYVKDDKYKKFYELRQPHKRCRKCEILEKDYGGKKSGLHPFGPLVSDVWNNIHRVKHNKYRDEHPCQLPVALLERIILMSSDEDDVIFDPFLGTGTTAIAAKRLGRKYLGIELDSKYAIIAENHLAKESTESKIAGVWVSMYLKNVITIRDKDWIKLIDSFIIPKNSRDIDTYRIKLKKETSSFKNERDQQNELLFVCDNKKEQSRKNMVEETRRSLISNN